jgi:spermidine dehydrogenase
MSDHTDHELGMRGNITRRDFLNGVAITAAAASLPWQAFAESQAQDSEEKCILAPVEAEMFTPYYPPALTGLRGSHSGAPDAAHCLRDETLFKTFGEPPAASESYDLITVGGGISGLSAAHFYRKKAGANARILILDNHDDFGGHAKRNEFTTGNAFRLGFGGTYSIESPAPYSPQARGLIEELGIDVASYPKYHDATLYGSLGMHPKFFFDKETFGADQLAACPNAFGGGERDYLDAGGNEAWKQFLDQAPIAPKAKQDFLRLLRDQKDYFPSLNSTAKKAKLARLSYANYLRDVVKVHEDVVKLFQAVPQPWFGLGIDAVSAQDAWGLGFPGFDGLKLDPAPGKGMNRDAIPNEEAEKYFFHFPDGNATIARLLVRRLIPDAIPGNSVADMILAKADYSKLDAPATPVKIRLNSTAVRVKHVGDAATAQEVDVSYIRGGKLYTARAKSCVLACWHVVIPYICQELPSKQLKALRSAQKVPLLYTNVALRNWNSFQKLGANAVYAPGCYHTRIGLDLAVSLGGYQCARKPEEPIVVHMMKTPGSPGQPSRIQHTLGRAELFSTNFETIERNIRDQLTRILSPGGFDPVRDITAITVNRWPHGYAYEYNSLFDSFWLEGGEIPCEVARKTHGRIAIANADAGAYAYTDEAINQAWRAVGELNH